MQPAGQTNVNHISSTKKPNRRIPCLNYIQKCNKCSAFVWKYNLKHHFEDAHPQDQFEDPVSGEEKAAMSRSKQWTAYSDEFYNVYNG